MATIKCIIRKDQPDKTGECRITVLYRHSNSPALKLSLGEKINPNYFDEKLGRVVKHVRAKEINHLIETTINNLNDVVFDLKRSGISPSVEDVKKGYEKFMLRTSREKIINSSKGRDSGISVYDAWNEIMMIKRNQIDATSLSTYATTLNHLINFCDIRGSVLSWELFDLDFHNHWTNYFLEEFEHKDGSFGLSNNTIGKYLKTLKQFLNWSVKKGYHKNLDYKNYKIYAERGDIFPLRESHLVDLIKFADDENNSLRLRKTASIFIFLCFSGLRFSDAKNLRAHDLYFIGQGDDSMKVIRFRTQKTDQKLIIALNRYSIGELLRNAKWIGSDILIQFFSNRSGRSKWGETANRLKDLENDAIFLLPQLSNVKFNEYIKEVGELCGFNEKIVITRKKGTKVEKLVFERWQKLSSHDGRRTFVTMNLRKGMRPETVMEFTGHKSFKTMLRYNNIDQETIVEEFHAIWKDEVRRNSDTMGVVKLGQLKPKKKYFTEDNSETPI